MRIDPLKQYAQLREKLTAEKAELEARLQQINAVLTSPVERTGAKRSCSISGTRTTR